MATFKITNITYESVTFKVTGLTKGDTVQFYVRLASDSSDQTVNKTYTATSTTMTKTFYGLEPETTYKYNFWLNGSVVYSSGPSFTTEAEPTVSRPWDWAFYSTIVSGGKIGLTALEWNNFCARINEFRDYCGLSSYNFTTVVKGKTLISASIVNEARTAISAMPHTVSLPSKAASGGTITAYFFNRLVAALNSIP